MTLLMVERLGLYYILLDFCKYTYWMFQPWFDLKETSRAKEKEKKIRERKGEKSMVTLLFYFGCFREKTTEPILAVIMLSKSN